MGLEELIRTKGYTYNSLAKVIGKSTMTIKRWADGVNEPNCADIKAYLGCGLNKASKIRQLAIKKHNGLNPLLPQKVKKDSVLKALEIKN